jgi:hypothetical protein
MDEYIYLYIYIHICMYHREGFGGSLGGLRMLLIHNDIRCICVSYHYYYYHHHHQEHGRNHHPDYTDTVYNNCPDYTDTSYNNRRLDILLTLAECVSIFWIDG